MIEVFLIYPTPEGSQEIPLADGGQLSLGRGSDADLRFDDDGMSRLNATIFREGENVWVLDENSTNGTFVNGREVSPSGTVLKNGDAVKIGHYTTIRIRIAEKQAFAPIPETHPTQTVVAATASGSSISPSHILPIAITAFAVLIIGISAVFIGVKVLGNNQPEIVRSTPSDAEDFPEDYEDEDTKKSPTPKQSDEKTPETSNTPQTSASPSSLPESNNKPVISSFSRKKYTEMSESEKDAYVKEKSEKIARIIGNQSSEPIPAEAIKTIRNNLQGYVNRVRAGRSSSGASCGFGGDMTTVMQRASKNAPFIIRAFYAEGLDPQIGLYVAMIESEHCPCLQSPTKALGMFQFVRGTGREYNLSVKDDASPANPDQRCEPEPSARAAAQYLKTLTGRFGTGPMSVMLAVASYNSGQGGLSKNLEAALRAASNQERSFWTLVANQVAFEGKIGEQFRRENVKYVPKFFAAAIIGENPQDFGIDMQPLSTYTK